LVVYQNLLPHSSKNKLSHLFLPMLYLTKCKNVIIIKWTNYDKRLNHKWAFFEHFDFFIEVNFWRFFFATYSLKYLKFPQ
jgi:hypothetical protein